MTERTLVRQETMEACMLAMEDLVGHASDLEIFGFDEEAEQLRSIAGELEQFAINMREGRKHHG